MKTIIIVFTSFLLFASCSSDENAYDASGTFEAIETIVSAEATGTIHSFNIEEGQTLKRGAFLGFIDSTQLYLKRKQLQAQVRAVLSKKPNISVQLAALLEELQQAEREQRRVASLIRSDAATQKQLDDASAQVSIIKRKIAAQESVLGITTSSLREETLPLQVQMEQLDDQLAKCKIINAVNGTVLTKYAETYETAVAGKPLYKIADLSNIILRAYVTGDQFSQIKLSQNVTVVIDDREGKYKEYPGTVQWISDKAEFTPKTIQTHDERANLVYAVKIGVKNDGFLKLGMYAEVKF
ncbi:HlyD family efflux transporter periplasmic adaptor subunit [Chryseolinea sp. H1M3-3]|uniref:HlyD family secretion protein n=1 Tax=Chryseolinea sp. H1M3-3 TaxID=3034144 RepID=UPI0023EDBE95|nr:HlyD family efflux transporter periplasmic adaptor subunit [Chryseolinea sp. H1M3-3]